MAGRRAAAATRPADEFPHAQESQLPKQVGGALGVAGLATLAVRHAASQASHGLSPRLAAVHGYVLAFRIGAVMLVIGGVVVLALLERVSTEARNPLAETGIEPPALPAPEALASAARA